MDEKRNWIEKYTLLLFKWIDWWDDFKLLLMSKKVAFKLQEPIQICQIWNAVIHITENKRKTRRKRLKKSKSSEVIKLLRVPVEIW